MCTYEQKCVGRLQENVWVTVLVFSKRECIGVYMWESVCPQV